MKKLLITAATSVLSLILFASCSNVQTTSKREIAEARYYEAVSCKVPNVNESYCIVKIPHLLSTELAIFRIESHDGGIDFDRIPFLTKDSKFSSDGFEIIFADGRTGMKSSASNYRDNQGTAVFFEKNPQSGKVESQNMKCKPSKFDSQVIKGGGVSTFCD